MNKLKLDDVDKAFKKREKGRDYFDIEKYNDIIASLHKVNVSSDKNFQKLYNGFYKLRQHSPDWYKAYYSCMEKNKNNPSVTFEQILMEIFNATGRIEASFSSKMLSTINTKMPLWDTFVLLALGIKKPSSSNKEKRLCKIVTIYNEICNWYNDLFTNHKDIADEAIKKFDEHCPNSQIGETKKIDYILWLIGYFMK